MYFNVPYYVQKRGKMLEFMYSYIHESIHNIKCHLHWARDDGMGSVVGAAIAAGREQSIICRWMFK